MKCHVCGSELERTVTSLPFKTGEDSVVIVKNLPVAQCGNCREYLIEDVVMARVESILDRIGPAAELEVVRYAA
ncbi:MAG: YgiT-type zinc finger protein [Magnetococcales bacterium]|nr:YgiT-type zinc finger protein [Magnetococcales bacterium]MBF0603789.1 YgiT-type zinc finger protein [Magnetococcales bacterium]HAT48995.1 YgiT-type zinc finger domain-containing protein [Alphaproteobacteria bacterium]